MTVLYISSKATEPVVTEFHVEPPGTEGTKVCLNGSGHMTNLAALPLYGKNLQKSSSRKPVEQWP